MRARELPGGDGAADLRPTLIYCRESRDENSENYQRIETQRDILLRFCRRRGLENVVDVVLDDDVSGTGFRRFDAVLERVRRGEIQVLVFKDASRLGRNLKESLIFTDAVENCGAEILFESEEYNEDFFPLKAWFNEQRAKEDSQKIRRVLHHKMETGTLLVKPFYGYRRGADGAMVPDEETASVVRRIFRQVQQGKTSGEIAAELNALGVPTPSQQTGQSNCAACWGSQHIRRIAANPVYTGTMIHNRTGKKSYKDKRTVLRPESEWIVLERHHPALISQAEFDEAQAVRKKFRRTKYTPVNRPFSGLLQCGRCGSRLVLRCRKNRPDSYLCGKNHREGGCPPHHVRESQLCDAARGYLSRLLGASHVDVAALAQKILENDPARRQAGALEKKLAQTRRAVDRMYDDRLSGAISQALFQRKYREYAAAEAELTRRLASLSAGDAPSGERRLTDLRMNDIIEDLSGDFLTKELVRLAFDRVLVYEAGEIAPADQMHLGLSPADYETIRTRGGILFLENAAPQSIPAGRL